MKTFRRIIIAALLLALSALPAVAKSPPGPRAAGKEEYPGKPASNTPAGTAVSNGHILDAGALFKQLDTDKDGKLNQREFARISDVLRQPTGSNRDR